MPTTSHMATYPLAVQAKAAISLRRTRTVTFAEAASPHAARATGGASLIRSKTSCPAGAVIAPRVVAVEHHVAGATPSPMAQAADVGRRRSVTMAALQPSIPCPAGRVRSMTAAASQPSIARDVRSSSSIFVRSVSSSSSSSGSSSSASSHSSSSSPDGERGHATTAKPQLEGAGRAPVRPRTAVTFGDFRARPACLDGAASIPDHTASADGVTPLSPVSQPVMRSPGGSAQTFVRWPPPSRLIHSGQVSPGRPADEERALQEAVKKRANEQCMVLLQKNLSHRMNLRYRGRGEVPGQGGAEASLHQRRAVVGLANDFNLAYANTRDVMEGKLTFRPPLRSHTLGYGELRCRPT